MNLYVFGGEYSKRMAFNPSDYDVGELRELVYRGDGRYDRAYGIGGFLWPVTPNDLEDPDPETVKEWEQVVSGSATKPFLSNVPPDDEAEDVIFEWLEWLQSRAGFEGCLDALRYYRSIEWLTADAEETLQEYLIGVGRCPGNSADDLDRRDHMRSLMFIARLSSLG